MQSTPWSNKTWTRIFLRSKTITEIVLYKIYKDTSKVFNWRNCDSCNNLKVWEESILSFFRPWGTLQEFRVLFGFNFYTYSDSTCKFIIYTRKFLREVSPTLEMLLCVDRFMVVIFLTKFALMRKNVNIFFVIIAILLIYSFLNIGNLFFEVKSEQISILFSNKSVLKLIWILNF